MTPEDPSKRELADDPSFLDSLSDLDRGLTEGEPRSDARSDARTTPPDSPLRPRARPRGSAAPSQTGSPEEPRPRRLLELFPSPEALEAAARSSAAPKDAPASVAPAARLPADRSQPIAPPIPQPPAPAAHETFYGLHEPPFALTSDLRFLYHSDAHDRAAQALLDAIRRRDGIVLLTGEMGVGKTMLCRAVMDQLDRRTLTSFVADPFVAPEELLKTLLVDFGVISAADRSRATELPDLSAALRDFLYSLAPLQAFAVVVVDEAQSLSDDLLQQVRTLADTGGDEQLLQLLLVGQPPLAGTLAKPPLRSLFQRISARTTLGPLAADEIAGYVDHRLHVAGPAARVEFAPEAAARLYELSRGIPRVVNLLCDRALRLGHEESAAVIDDAIVLRAAEDLDLAPPRSKMASAIRVAALIGGFVLLMLVGAAAGAYVFRDEIGALIDRWRAAPAAAPPQSPPPGRLPGRPQGVVPPPERVAPVL